MAITTMDGVVNGLASGKSAFTFCPSATNVAGGLVNLQRAVVTSFGQMAIPAANTAGGTSHVQTDTGFPNLGTPEATRYLAKVEMTGASAGAIHIYDRVWSCSGFSGTVTTAQAVTGFPTLTRPDSNGTGLEIWIECYTATGATASFITVQYTNQAGTSGRNTVSTAHIISMPANRMYQVPLQSGDKGVRSVQSVTLSSTTGSAGNFGVTLMERIATIPLTTANVPNVQDFASLGLPAILNDTAINLIHQGTTTSSGIILGNMIFIEG